MPQNISSRQHQILEQLRENRNGLSIDELAKLLQISRTAVQQQFVALESEGYIKKHTLTKTAGRPLTLYAITDKGINCFPKQYAWFSELILSDLQEEISPERFKGYMQRLAGKLAKNLKGRFAGKKLDERIDELSKIMTDLGFQIKTAGESGDDKEIIQANNCIYHDLAQKHQEICEFDLTFMSSLLDREVEQLSCMAKGDCNCKFRIKK
ncbi:helix-turn-helix transcriptional regulator [Candidatus Methylobacter favarea]|nr:HTH domain-containing protein [Candidatus Methylobacter favarea]